MNHFTRQYKLRSNKEHIVKEDWVIDQDSF